METQNSGLSENNNKLLVSDMLKSFLERKIQVYLKPENKFWTY
jgi:hypothetical protein